MRQFVAFNPNQVKSATRNNGEYSQENNDTQMAIKRTSVNNSLSLQEKNNIRTLLKTINRTGTTLLDGGNGTIYLLDHTDKEGIEDRNPKTQDGFNCRLKFSTEGLTDEDLKTIKKAIEDGTIRDQISFDKWAKSNIGKQRGDNSDSIDAKGRATNANNDRLDIQTSGGESGRGLSDKNSSNNLGGDFIRVAANDGTNGPRYIPINQGASAVEDELQMFIGKKVRTQFEQTLRKTRPDMSDEEIQSTLDFLHSLEDLITAPEMQPKKRERASFMHPTKFPFSHHEFTIKRKALTTIAVSACF